jgi:hypothetical protein
MNSEYVSALHLFPPEFMSDGNDEPLVQFFGTLKHGCRIYFRLIFHFYDMNLLFL